MLFKHRFIEQILNNEKTQTRRNITSPKYKIGRVYRAQKNYFDPGFALIRILSTKEERVIDISEQDAKQEGFASSIDFLEYYAELHPDQPLSVMCRAYTFECVADLSNFPVEKGRVIYVPENEAFKLPATEYKL
jgi:hypothetical protein